MTQELKTVCVQMTQKNYDRLVSLRDLTDASGDTEVIANALRLYEDIVEKYREGTTFYVMKDGLSMPELSSSHEDYEIYEMFICSEFK